LQNPKKTRFLKKLSGFAERTLGEEMGLLGMKKKGAFLQKM
jgi:hypothetical protein